MNKMKNNINISACVAVLTLICTSSAYAGGDVEAKKPKGLLDNGLISLTKTVPPFTRVFDYEGNIWDRSTMLGDMDGTRTELYNDGISLDATVTQIVQKVTSGGSADGNGNTQYNGLLEVNGYLDTAKLGWWSGGVISVTMMSSWDHPLLAEVGNLSPVNFTGIWPTPFDDRTEMSEYYLAQALPGEMLLLVGRMDMTNFLDKNSFANNPESQFLNANLNNNLLWGEFMTFSTYAALLVMPINKDLTVAVSVLDPETQPGHSGVWDHYAAALALIYDYEISGLKGVFNPVIAYTNKDSLGLDNPLFVPGVIEGNVPHHKGNWMFTITGEQYLWTPEGSSGADKKDYFEPTQDFVSNQPGLGLFYRFAYTPEERNPYNIVVSGGLGGRGLVPGRPLDRMGIGAYTMLASDDLKDKILLNATLKDEVGFEAYYNYAITPWMQLSVDAQYIDQGIASSDNAWVLGTRLFTRF